MNEEILVKIITPASVMLECKAEIVTMPGEYGEFGVLPEHSSLVAHLHPGIMRISMRHNNFEYFIYSGMAQVTPKEVNVATEFAVDLKSINKFDIIEKIDSLKKEVLIETDSDIIFDINHELEQYESLLSFLK